MRHICKSSEKKGAAGVEGMTALCNRQLRKYSRQSLRSSFTTIVILVHNLKHTEDKKPELTADEVELLTSLMELTNYKDAIMEAMYRGTKRNVESEPEGKKHGGRVKRERIVYPAFILRHGTSESFAG